MSITTQLFAGAGGLLFGGGVTIAALREQLSAKRMAQPVLNQGTAIKRSVLPLGAAVLTTSILGSSTAIAHQNALESLPATPENVTMHDQRHDLLTISRVSDDIKSVRVGSKQLDPSTSYLTSGERTQYWGYIGSKNNVMEKSLGKPVDVNQFVIEGTKSKKPIVLETSGDRIKIIRDLDPKGSTKPYYSASTCTWKNSDVTKACPIAEREIHLYSDSVDFPGVITNNPWNTNDDTTDPKMASAVNVADDDDVQAAVKSNTYTDQTNEDSDDAAASALLSILGGSN